MLAFRVPWGGKAAEPDDPIKIIRQALSERTESHFRIARRSATNREARRHSCHSRILDRDGPIDSVPYEILSTEDAR